jgi:hypothetical protein
MPSLLSDKFQSYANNIPSPIFAKFPRLLYYIFHYNIPWIMGSNCEISVGTSIKYITRKISIRWWEKFTYEPILQKIQQEFELGDKNQFLLQKIINQANIASFNSKKENKKK